VSDANELRIASVDVSAYKVPTERPEADGTLAWDSTSLIVVEPQTRGGVRGLGFAYGDASMASLVREHLASQVEGIDVRDTGAAWESMVCAVRNLGRTGLASMAIAAVDIALWDTKGRCLGQPVHKLLAAQREAVPVYGSGGFTTYPDDVLREQLSGWVEAGIPRVKMKIGADCGTSEEDDLRRIRVAREAIGSEAELFVDANGAYNRTQARRLGMRFVEEFGVRWFEEPVTSDDRTGLRMLSEELPLDVTAGEYGYFLDYFETMLADGAVDVLQADIGRCAGISEWLRVAAVAQAHKIPFSGHCGPSLHVHAATVPPNLRHLEYFHDHVRIENMLFDGVLQPKDGCLWPSDRPGIGLEFKRADAERYRTH
jgi:L-alanine-DL-glutamate epimerase-like enolase superfamily enzyme